MVKMKLNLRNALKSTLLELTSKTRKVLVFGEDRMNNKTFCYPVDILRNRLRLLACTSIEIRSIGYFPHAYASILVDVVGGYMGFESWDDYAVWNNQK